MPSNRGHGHHHSRWYKLCFSDNSADSSDDSDTDPVFRARSSAPSVSIEEYSFQEEPPDSDTETENGWLFPPSSPPPPPLPPPPPPPPSFYIQSLRATYEAVGSRSGYAPRSPVDQLWPVTETGGIPRVPDEAARTIRLVEISSVHLRDELSHCPVCMEDFEVGDTVCVLACGHAYRPACILRWLETSRTCPVCRVELREGSHGRAVESHSEMRRPPSAPPYGTLQYFDYYFPELEGEEISGARDHNSEEAEHYDSARDEIDDDDDDGREGGVRG